MSKETVCINAVGVDEDRKVPEEMHHVEYERIEYINIYIVDLSWSRIRRKEG